VGTRDQRSSLLGGLSLDVLEHRRVDLLGDGRGGMAEQLAGELEVSGGPIGQRRGQVAQVVQTDRRQPGADHQSVEALGDAVGHQGGPVWVIDFGAYVDLIHTKSEPVQLLAWDDVPADAGTIEVPAQDLRAIRRADLDLDAFEGQTAST
jgi:hypothetical protein